MPVVNLPDGKRINFPAGTPPAEMQSVIEQASGNAGGFGQQAAGMDPVDLSVARSKNDDFGEYLRAQASQPRQGETPEQTFQRQYGGISTPEVGMGEGIVRSGLQGSSFGTGDEVVAAGAAALNKATGKDLGREFGELYDAYLARERGDLGQFRDAHPVASTVSEISGAIPTALLAPGIRAAQGAGLTTRMGTGAVNAGTQAGVYGFNAGEGGAENRLANAAKTAAIAAPIGVAAPALGAVGRNLANRLMTNSAAKQAGMPRASYDVLTRAMDADGSLNGPGAARIRAAGPQAMLADSGPNTMSLLDTAVQKSGPAATVARNAIDDRVTAASGSINSAMDDALGVPQGLRRTAQGIAKSTAGVRDDAYTAAYSKPVNYADTSGQRIEGVLKKVPNSILKRAVDEANDEMVSLGQRNQQIMAQIADDGSVTFREMPNVQQLDEIKKALQRIGYSEVDQFGRPTGTGQRARRLAGELRSALGDAVDEYNVATKAGGDKIAMDNALDLGRRLLSPTTTRELVEEGVSGMSPAERRMVAQGVRSQIDEALSNVKRAMTDSNMDAREASKALRELSSRAAREKLSAVLGEKEAAKLFGEVDRAASAFELRANVATNSKTFARQSLDDSVRAQTDDGVVNTLRSGEPVNAAKRLTQMLTGRTPAAKERVSDQTYSSIVEALTGPRGADALRMIQQMQASQQRIPQGSAQWGRLAEMLMGRNAAIAAPVRENVR